MNIFPSQKKKKKKKKHWSARGLSFLGRVHVAKQVLLFFIFFFFFFWEGKIFITQVQR